MARLCESTSPVPSDAPTAVVVGAGVSGCACAAVLAGHGVCVTLLNSALDRVNLPAYGAELVAGPAGWREIEETMAMLPVRLRQAWLGSAAVPGDGAPVVIIDRRATSIETKRTLEQMPGLKFRQGLVTDLWLRGPGKIGDLRNRVDCEGEASTRVTIGTAFGETFEADAVVLAVGLGLGGTVAVGEESLHGGRYGETPADGLKDALEALGASFRAVTLEVGARFVGDGTGLIRALTRADASHRCHRTVDVRQLVLEQGISGSVSGCEGLEGARAVVAGAFPEGWATGADGARDASGAADCSSGWPASYPPAVHWNKEFPRDEVVLRETDDQVRVPLLSSDGRATEEIHLSYEGAGALRARDAHDQGATGALCQDGLEMSRPGYSVRALIVESLAAGGRLEQGYGAAPAIWVTGRAAGAFSYLTSLRSGALTGADVARALRRPRGQEEGADL